MCFVVGLIFDNNGRSKKLFKTAMFNLQVEIMLGCLKYF